MHVCMFIYSLERAPPAGLDSDSPSYTLEETSSAEGGGEFAGSLGGGGGSLGRTGFGPVSSSSTISKGRGLLWCGLFLSCGVASFWLRGSPYPQPGILLGVLMVTFLVEHSTPFLDLRSALAHT